MLAVGSNAAPVQLTRKLGPSGVLPMTLASVHGLAAGVSAHVSHGRYVPAAPIAAPGEHHMLFVIWPDEAQLAVLDRTEPNYRRTVIGPEVTVQLTDGPEAGVELADGQVRACEVYVSRWGILLDAEGRPRRLGDQRELVAALLAGSADLRALFGRTPEDFIVAAADEARRVRARAVFAAEGWVDG